MKMSKYSPLEQFLRSSMWGRISLTFSKIEKILGFSLPKSAYIYNAWWGNSDSSQASAWRSAGYKVESVNLKARKVSFRRTGWKKNRSSQPKSGTQKIKPTFQNKP